MEPIRTGIIGVGIMGTSHLRMLKAQPEHFTVTAICDTNPERFAIPEAEGITHFEDYRELLDSGLCELVAVATPHPCHGEIAMAALSKGLHVLCEKPLTDTVAKTDALVAAARASGKVFATNFGMRTYPLNRLIKSLIDEGRLGKILRADFVCTNWMRSQRYYDMQSWRGSWNGEGGGVLMNQAPHNLDLLYWWFGEMESVRGHLTTRFHKIETEDEVEAVFITKNGHFPVRFYANTGEAPGIDRMEIVGEKGTLIREGGKLIFRELKKTVPELLGGEDAFPKSETEDADVPIPDQSAAPVVAGEKSKSGGYNSAKAGAPFIWENVASAVREGTPLYVPGVQGWAAVEFANAITLSHFTNSTVKFPVDRKAYDALLQELKQGKKGLI